ncbi:hypothetical protein AYR62_03755 [Secundilactobacillus paracollinoides]|uniref:Uncharacterized protein n=1 Tax=Secundilactobacillus paracollinoides TaxID=240427 RepID=A0A1B2IZV6_9LACO|nr:hypothetical protein [Secundilactobacillus paracollinoides]ANZ61664.1 hypothetical protein AYR61_10045 [Secundilactobacillus paracollinoides]ANZ63301.1 hypothetical protein AYR62_03755 [Secundilactobacillus paracollinoides]ANZ67582.1 hypothetical protein AYR63_10790 [Secundilactobacillus paracollinoides]
MASNSDSIYNVLTYVKRHPDRVIFKPQEFTNVVTIGIPDTVKVANQDIYFPSDRLSVNLMTDDFLGEYGDLLDHFYELTKQTKPDYRDVWITTSHLKKEHLFLLDLSFE